MSYVSSTVPTSRRSYLSQDELEQMADITVTDTQEADDQIAQAEEFIDAYVGAQERFFPNEIIGMVSTATSTTITLAPIHQGVYYNGYFQWCEVEIIGGTGSGQRRTIESSTQAGVFTLRDAWAVTPSTDSVYKVYQLGKFPRVSDVYTITDTNPVTVYKSIPEAVKRAVAAQVEFFVELGNSYFRGDKSEYNSETIGDYSYTKGAGFSGAKISKLVSPKAKSLLKGITRRWGVIRYD